MKKLCSVMMLVLMVGLVSAATTISNTGKLFPGDSLSGTLSNGTDSVEVLFDNVIFDSDDTGNGLVPNGISIFSAEGMAHWNWFGRDESAQEDIWSFDISITSGEYASFTFSPAGLLAGNNDQSVFTIKWGEFGEAVINDPDDQLTVISNGDGSITCHQTAEFMSNLSQTWSVTTRPTNYIYFEVHETPDGGATQQERIGIQDFVIGEPDFLPVHLSVVDPSWDVLKWTLVEPNNPADMTYVDVYFGTDQQSWSKIIDNEPNIIETTLSERGVTLAPSTDYVWRVEEYDPAYTRTDPNNPLAVFDLQFSTNSGNYAPTVDPNVADYDWLVDGTTTVDLYGTVTDDGAALPLTITWSIESEPSVGAATIASPNDEDTTVTMTVAGDYTLRLTADDTEYVVYEEVVVTIYADGCVAAQNEEPGFAFIEGDVNKDCEVDIDDLIDMASVWLTSNAATLD